MRVTPRRLPFTATQITEGNIVELAQIHARELYVTESAPCIDWDADTLLGVGDYIVTDAEDKLVGVHDSTELLQNYTIQETK